MTRTFRLPALLAVMALPALLPLPLSAQQTRARDRDEYQSRIDTTLAFDHRGTVSLTIGSGEIVVSAWERPQVRISARSERGEVRLDATAARLTLDLLRRSGGDSRFEVTVPQGVTVNARSQSGDITITGTRAPVEISTQNGDVRIQDVANLDVSTFNGDIDVRGVNGNVDVNALSGDITISEVRGEVEVTAVSGDIDLRGITAKFVRAKSTSGDIDFDATVDPAGRYELASHAGTVTLIIPRATGALLSLSTYSGSIDSDFPITLKPGEHGIGHPRRFTFEVGKGDARISAESFSGDINVRVKGGRTNDQ